MNIEINHSYLGKTKKEIENYINVITSNMKLSTNEVYSLPINYIPENGYVDNINYTIEDNSVITVEDNFIKGISTGRTSLTVVVAEKDTSTVVVLLASTFILLSLKELSVLVTEALLFPIFTVKPELFFE